MATRNVTKRKRPADDEGQGLSKPDPRKYAKGKPTVISGSKRGKKKAMGDDDEEFQKEGGEHEDSEDESRGEGGDNDDGDYDDNHSQKRRMMLFERKLKAIKKQKKTSFEDSTSKFNKKVKSNEETLINSLLEQRAKIKSNANTFSKTLATLLHDALGSFSGSLIESTTDSSNPVQKHPLHAPQISIAALSTKLLTYAQSLQATLATIVDHELIPGEGWEQDGDLSISALRQAKENALLRLMRMISHDEEEEIGEMTWKHTTKRSEKGIKKLLRNLPVSATDVEEK